MLYINIRKPKHNSFLGFDRSKRECFALSPEKTIAISIDYSSRTIPEALEQGSEKDVEGGFYH